MQDGEEPEGKDLQPVRHQDVEEQGEAERDDEECIVRHVLLDQAAQEVVTPLKDRLHLGRGPGLELAADPERHRQRDDGGQRGRDEAVVIEHAKVYWPDGAAPEARCRMVDVDVHRARRPWRIEAATISA